MTQVCHVSTIDIDDDHDEMTGDAMHHRFNWEDVLPRYDYEDDGPFDFEMTADPDDDDDEDDDDDDEEDE